MTESHFSVAVLGGAAILPLVVDKPRLDDRDTAYGQASGAPAFDLARVGSESLVGLHRHGWNHEYAPHRINYRANLALLEGLGVRTVLAIHTVGGILESLPPGALVVPDQLIDYTWGRESTFGGDGDVRHIDFSDPFDADLRALMCAGVPTALEPRGVYGCTQGPRLETRAEIARMARDGCTVVGMTAMPEAALARELGMRYASLCLVVNYAAGVAQGIGNLDAFRGVVDAAGAQLRQSIVHAFEGIVGGG